MLFWLINVIIIFVDIACLRGYFGQDCSEKCIETCAGCNNVNGLCDSGCIPGWKGYFCNKGIDRRKCH